MNRLNFAIFLFKLPLHLKISLALFLDALLLHVSNNTCVHGLPESQSHSQNLGIEEGNELTAFSAFWAQWTNATMPIVPATVLNRVIFEAVDILKISAKRFSCFSAQCLYLRSPKRN
jgi:Na+/H+ antiporter NhaB